MAQVQFHPDVRRFGPEIQALLQQLTPSQVAYFNIMYARRCKIPIATFLSAIFCIDHFYLEQFPLGVLKVLVGLACVGLMELRISTVAPFLLAIYALWWLMDVVSFSSRTRIANERIALDVLRHVKELVSPNAPPPPVTGQPDNSLLIVLAVIAITLLVLAIALVSR
jgi:hypothetical protein